MNECAEDVTVFSLFFHFCIIFNGIKWANWAEQPVKCPQKLLENGWTSQFSIL